MGKMKKTVGNKTEKTKVKKEKLAEAEPKIEHGSDADEAPDTIPIARTEEVPKVAKKNKKKQKRNKKPAAQNGGVEKKEKDPKVNIAKKLKKLKRSVLVNEAKEPEVIADPPSILATTDAITTAVIALRKATEEEAKEKKKLFDKDFRYCLQICHTKIPKVPTRQVRLDLAHSCYDDTDEVCLFVRDKEIGKNKDPELTIQQYEQLFREQKIDFINKVMPVAQLKADYASFEMKKKLEQTYDVFLADAIIGSYVFGLVGKKFINKRKTPTPVKLKNVDTDKWKVQLQRALCKTAFKQGGKGPSIAIPVATHKLSVDQFVANIETVLEQLKKEYPGGWLNIRNIYLKPMENSNVSLPIYISEINPNEVPTPVVVGPKARHVIKMAKKLERESGKFTMTEKGVIEKKKVKQPKKEKKDKKTKVVKEEPTEEANESPENGEDNDEVEASPESETKKRKAPIVAAVPQKKKQKKIDDEQPVMGKKQKGQKHEPEQVVSPKKTKKGKPAQKGDGKKSFEKPAGKGMKMKIKAKK